MTIQLDTQDDRGTVVSFTHTIETNGAFTLDNNVAAQTKRVDVVLTTHIANGTRATAAITAHALKYTI